MLQIIQHASNTTEIAFQGLLWDEVAIPATSIPLDVPHLAKVSG